MRDVTLKQAIRWRWWAQNSHLSWVAPNGRRRWYVDRLSANIWRHKRYALPPDAVLTMHDGKHRITNWQS